jgi:hypothetical protein
VPGQQRDLLTQLEQDVADRTVPIAEALRKCILLGSRTRSPQLREWATRELKGYPRIDSLPDYRVIAAPITWDVHMPYRGVGSYPVNVRDLPSFVSERINESVPLNQSIEELESLAAQCEMQNEPVCLGVIGGEFWMEMWNKNNTKGETALRMYWTIHPAALRAVVGQVRTVLTELVADLRFEVGDNEELPTAEQTTKAWSSAVGAMQISGSHVTFIAASTEEGDIMPEGPRTTIKDNKTTIKDSTGNISVASAHVTQLSAGGVDLEKAREFADLIKQIAPTLGISAEQQADLETTADELLEAASDPGAEPKRFRRLLGNALKSLGFAGATAAQKVAVAMGDDLIRQLGDEVVRELGH